MTAKITAAINSPETMIRGGEPEAVRDYRLRFQAVIAPELIRRVEDVLDRKSSATTARFCLTPTASLMFVLDRAREPGTNDSGEVTTGKA